MTKYTGKYITRELTPQVRLKCFRNAIASHLLEIIGIVFFSGILVLIAFCAFRFRIYQLLLFQITWPLIFYFGYTVVSSVDHYYKKNIVQKFGMNLSAIITGMRKEENDIRVRGRYGQMKVSCKEIFYYFEYRYRFEGSDFTGVYPEDDEEIFSRLTEGNEIPIRIMKFDPSVSYVRTVKLRKDLGIKAMPKKLMEPDDS